jgi:YVTN family beta-propeller protein
VNLPRSKPVLLACAAGVVLGQALSPVRTPAALPSASPEAADASTARQDIPRRSTAARPAAPVTDSVSDAKYLSPIEIAVTSDGSRLFVVCETSGAVAVVDVKSGTVIRRIPVGNTPKGISLSADGKHAYVANSWSDTVSEIDTASLETVREFRAGMEPNSVATDARGGFIYAANRISSDVSVIDVKTGEEVRRLSAGRGASYLATSPGNRLIYCTHIYPRLDRLRRPPESEMTVIDPERQIVVEREPMPDVAGVFHAAISSDGRLGIACQLRPKNLIPLAHVAHGWAFGNSLTVFGEDVGESVQVLIDELDRYFAVPFGVAIAPDKSAAYITASGSNTVTVVNIARLLKFVRSKSPAERRELGNDLSAAAEFVDVRIPVGRNPKGIAVSPDGSRIYVANRLDDDVSVIDTRTRRELTRIDLGGPKILTQVRRGERIFYSAKYAFQEQFGCANCHIEATFDGLAWDLEPDGFGKDIVDNRLLEEVSGTEPFKWNGGNPDLETECGPRTEKFFYRSQSYSPKELADLVAFIKAMPARPNRYRLPKGELTPAQEWGKAIFERTKRNNGTEIPGELQCPICHSGSHYTNQQMVDVGSGKPADRSPLVDVPQLTNVVLTAPYLHDGSAPTLEEIWTVFNPNDTHGVTNDLNKDELNDLIEYLKTL